MLWHIHIWCRLFSNGGIILSRDRRLASGLKGGEGSEGWNLFIELICVRDLSPR